MRQAAGSRKSPGEKIVKDIKRATMSVFIASVRLTSHISSYSP